MFDTHLLANAPIVRGRVTGDLILEGAGDPSLDDQSLWQLAAQIRGAGVEVVSGDLFVDPSPFGVVTCETEDRCHALQSSDSAYNAPLASVGVDFGNWCMVVGRTIRQRGWDFTSTSPSSISARMHFEEFPQSKTRRSVSRPSWKKLPMRASFQPCPFSESLSLTQNSAHL